MKIINQAKTWFCKVGMAALFLFLVSCNGDESEEVLKEDEQTEETSDDGNENDDNSDGSNTGGTGNNDSGDSNNDSSDNGGGSSNTNDEPTAADLKITFGNMGDPFATTINWVKPENFEVKGYRIITEVETIEIESNVLSYDFKSSELFLGNNEIEFFAISTDDKEVKDEVTHDFSITTPPRDITANSVFLGRINEAIRYEITTNIQTGINAYKITLNDEVISSNLVKTGTIPEENLKSGKNNIKVQFIQNTPIGEVSTYTEIIDFSVRESDSKDSQPRFSIQ
ncbi:hypothetical protein [Reichenbachiella versicolor]|uniref:hypothetical protein n=1 Tax=Reichenbachiella versicolor TaxID=1821036 RepID=UPI000D6E262F|nr:hypothetical protein [Reichenbachiella versicolor]